MLVLSRRRMQAIRIGDDIEIVVADIDSNRVRLAIRAPRDMTILRGEVHERIQRKAGDDLDTED